MSHNIEIKEGAFIISDAHYSHLRPELLGLIEDIHTKKLIPSQLILMGDIFDALFGNIPLTQHTNRNMIRLLNEISQEIEVIYLEGNHDFYLKKIFPKIKTFSISKQPLSCKYNDKKVFLAHGDFDMGLWYKIYTALIRNPFLLFLLKYIDIFMNHLILKNVDNHLYKKNDCREFIGFKEYIDKRLVNKYKCEYFIEGHFHQNRTIYFKTFTYINLGAFACNQRYFIVKSLKYKELLEEKIFSKGI